MNLVQSPGTAVVPLPHPQILRTSAIARRVSASEPLAIILADLAFGPSRRDDVAMLASCSASRITEARQ